MARDKRRRERSGRGALTYLSVTALVLAAGGLCYFALQKGSDPGLQSIAAGYQPPVLSTGTPAPLPTAGESPSDSPSPAPSTTPTPSTTATASAEGPQTRVAILGDGYAHSDGATDAAHGFTALLGTAENWDVSVISCGLAGYAVKGSCGKTYAGLIPQLVAAKPQTVVITGGRNDVPQAANEAQAAAAFFIQLETALPDVTVDVVSPVWDSAHAPLALGTVQQAVRTAATAHGARYLDIGEPLRDHPEMVSPGTVLPDDAGYAAIAAAIEQALSNPSTPTVTSTPVPTAG